MGMQRFISASVVLLGILLAVYAFATPPTSASKPQKPPSPNFTPTRTPFPCTGRQTFTATLGWSTVVVDSTTDADSNLPSYGCLEWDETGPEHIYEIVVTDTIELVATLSGLNEVIDIDLFLMSDCDTDSCLVGDNTELAAVLSPGTYWLSVDTFGSDNPPGGPYTLTLSAFWPGIPANACASADTTFHPCDEAADLTSTLFEQPDLLRNYDCDGAGTIFRGGERWYALATPSLRLVQLTAIPTASAEALDLAMGLFTGCGNDSECLAFVDDALAGFSETLVWPHAATELDTVWLAVDSYAAPADSASGAFVLGVDCGTVPAKTSSFGSFRARFR